MTSQVIKNTFQNTYKDDYRDSDHYHRILFNPRRPVQARELTQSQTLIQKEMERFARNIFKEGAAVNPVANIFIDNTYSFVKISSVTTFDSSIIGNTFTGGTSGVSARILRVVDAEGADPATLYLAYISGGGVGYTNTVFTPGETITDGSTSFTVQTTNTTINPAYGNGTLASIGPGEFFVIGHFVFFEGGNVLVSKYGQTPSTEIGFAVTESIVTAADEIALYDNSGDNYNLTAPGADRYRIVLTPTIKDNVDSDVMFIYVAKIEDGIVVASNNGRTEYNKILDVMAERTYEESGNYTVTAPIAEFTEYAPGDSDNNLNLRVTNSISYVNGYRVETGPRNIDVAKPITTKLVENEAIGAYYGNYIEMSNLLGIPNITQLEKLNLIDNSDYASGSIIGTARLRAIETKGSNYLWHLFDVQMSGSNSFRDTRSIGTSTVENARVVLDRGNAVLTDVINNDLLFPLPTTRPSSISDISLTVQRVLTGTTDGSGEVAFNLTAPGETFSSQSDWIVTRNNTGAVITPTLTPTTTTTTTLTGGPVSQAVTVFAFVQKGGSSGSFRTKTLTTSTVTNSIESDGSGLLFINLENVDIYSLDSARTGTSSGANIKSKFRLDTGQRDNFYDLGRLILNTGETAPAGNVYVKFQHFTHGGTGNFFAINSYSGQVDYDEIPTYRQKNSVNVSLADVLDFRSTINDAGTGFTGTGARVNELPQNTELVTADVTYYLPRKDKLVVDQNDGIKYIKGDPAFSPNYPETPAGTMLVYQFSLNPNTLNNKDLRSQFIDNRRYTMRDIGRIDEKVEQVREIASLSLLELQSTALEVLDGDGLNRTKSGILADDFRDHRASDVENEEYRASIDPRGYKLYPSYRTKNIGLIFDSDQSSSTVLKGEMIMLDYTERTYIRQPEASNKQNVNPFTQINYDGTIELSPSSDEWVDEITVPVIEDPGDGWGGGGRDLGGGLETGNGRWGGGEDDAW